MSGHRVINSPSSHMYAATKFAVRAITDGLRYELNNMKSHIRVTVSNLNIVCANIIMRFCLELHV